MAKAHALAAFHTEENRAAVKVVADQLRELGFQVIVSGYTHITMRLKPTDAGFTVIAVADARKLVDDTIAASVTPLSK